MNVNHVAATILKYLLGQISFTSHNHLLKTGMIVSSISDDTTEAQRVRAENWPNLTLGKML